MVLPSQTSSGSNDQNHQLPVTRPVNTIASTYLQQHEQRYSPHGSSSEAAALTAITGTAEKRRSEDIVDHNAEPKFAESIAEIHTVDITDYKVKSNPSTTTTRHRSRVHSLANVAPPSFAESQFQTIQRRQAGVTLKYSSSPSRYPNLSNAWEFAGWGSTYYMEISPSAEAHDVPQLDQFRATAIAGNDLIASVLYTLGGTIVLAGKYAPISLFIVTIVIYPFKDIITEVGTALPLNGGTYNCMLNTTSKLFAAVAAALSILSYVATAVVSAATATAYLAGEVTLPTHLSVFWLTILVMVLFASVTLLGIKESSNLAFGIFTLHCCVLLVLMIMSVIHWRTIGSAILAANWYDTTYSATSPSAAALQIFNGFCIGLLGITGFESAENYIEDQKPGVFPKVMRNMWGLVFFFNAPIALLATAVVPMSVLMVSSANVLSVMAEYAGGKWLRWLIVADAVIVLCAGVLTGFIGVGGLIEKMASDQLLPTFLLHRNRWTGTHQYIILSFLVLCVTLYAIVGGDITSLSGVFAVSFLSVMCMFAIGNLFLKYKRGPLPRTVRVSSVTAIFGLTCLAAGLVGNFVIDPDIARHFFIYFAVIMTIMMVMLNRVWLLKTLFFYFDQITVLHRFPVVADSFIKAIRSLKKQPVVFFTKTDEIYHLNKAVLYVRANENAGGIKFVHIYEKIEDIPERLEANHRVLDEIYPKIQIDLIFIQGTFNPSTVDIISRMLSVPKSLMFICCPGSGFPHGIGEFGGIRTIML